MNPYSTPHIHLTDPTEAEQKRARRKILRWFSLIRKVRLWEDKSLPELIKTLAYIPCSQRFISSLFYSKSHHSYGDQMEGRDLKRWAAHKMGELFDEKAIIKEHRFKGFDGEYWHEC